MTAELRLTRRQRQVMRRIAGGPFDSQARSGQALLLLAESNGECWLFDVDEYDPTKTHEQAYRPVERISNILAERLVLRGLVRGDGVLTPLGKEALRC